MRYLDSWGSEGCRGWGKRRKPYPRIQKLDIWRNSRQHCTTEPTAPALSPRRALSVSRTTCVGKEETRATYTVLVLALQLYEEHSRQKLDRRALSS